MNSFDYIKTEKDLNKVRNVVAGKPMEKLLFELSVSSGLRLTEILYLKVKDVVGTHRKPFFLTSEARRVLEEYLAGESLENDSYLFHKKNDNSQHLSVPYVSNLVTKWFEEAWLEGHFAARSLYKTYEYFHSSDFGESGGESASDEILRLKKQSSYREKQLYELMYGRIISGRLPVNTCVNVSSIASEMSSSSTVVRIVLARLEEAKLVERISSRVYKIKAYSREYISELFNLREVLECHVFDRAVQNWDDGVISELEHLLRQWKNSIDTMYSTGFSTQGIIDCVYYHSAFHAAIYSAAEMPVTVKLISELVDKTNGFHLKHYSGAEINVEEDYRGIAEHQLMLDTLKVHNFDESRKLLIENIKKGYTIWLAHIGDNVSPTTER